MATKATTHTPTCQVESLIGRASLSAVATMRPDAEADTALHALRTASICAYCA